MISSARVLLALLPAVVFALIFLSLYRRFGRGFWRDAFLAAAVVLGTLNVAVIETLSLFGGIGFPAVAACWVSVCVLAGCWFHVSRRRASPEAETADETLPLNARLLLSGVALYLVVTAVIAVVAPPNTWDSMEYHLPKVMHWIQNESVAFYPTAIPRQNHLAPGAEYWVLHLHLLGGSDRLANGVEWFATLGSLVAISLIARQLGAQIVGQCVAAVFAATLPMGIMQATSTMTDVVVGFWFVCFVYFFLRCLQGEVVRWPLLLGLSASLGLAVFTKGTAYLFAPGFLVWLGLSFLKRFRARSLGLFAVITAVFLLLNGAHYARNWRVYGHPLGPREEPMQNTKYGIESHAPNALLSNFSKHVGTHINTPWPKLNAAIQSGYVSLHKAIGWDLNDPRTRWGGRWVTFKIGLTDFHEERAGNPLHFLLAIICGALVVVVPRLRRDRVLLKYTLAVAAGFFLFAFYLKWHPWMSRLHHGMFVAAAPCVAVVLVRFGRGSAASIVAAVLLVLGLPWLFKCVQRPVIAKENIFNTPRDRLYFKTPDQNYAAAFFAGREFLATRKVSSVGLITTNSSWEYMWWVFLREDNPAVRIEHVNVKDASARLTESAPFRDFAPEAVVMLDQRPQPETLAVGAATYARQWAKDRVAIYLKE